VVDTLSEDTVLTDVKHVGVLTYVLCYDDLVTCASSSLPPLGMDLQSFEIGRAPEKMSPKLENGVFRVWDPYVSSRHASIVRRGVVDLITDLESKHGTVVNGERIAPGRERVLQDQDWIEVGRSFFTYRRIDSRKLPLEPVMFHLTRTLSPELILIAQDLMRYAPTSQAILLLGETGTGKEVAARFVHAQSKRAGAYIAVNCGAISDHIIESELFGHRRGAFTGANEERKGWVRTAHEGTMLLDEIGTMPEPAQASLLRVIQEHEVVPVGTEKSISIDVRWIAATNVDIFAPGARFRADLRQRLAGYTAVLPPLRRRREDLGFLISYFLKKFEVPKAKVTKQAARYLFGGSLAGNVRELQQIMQNMKLFSDNEPLDVHHLPQYMTQSMDEVSGDSFLESAPPPTIAADSPTRRNRCPSRAELTAILDKAKGVQRDAAHLLGVHERQIARWMDMLGLPRARSGK
jgi:sigma-54 dependent transcriptional regulator, acetoin dehydrogenase operon transcriptional activator AcoR